MQLRRFFTPTNVVLALLIGFAAAARFWPHPANFTPVAAVALFSGVYLGKRTSILAPVVAMAISDMFLGWHNLIPVTWGSMALVGIIGWWVKSKKNPGTIALGALAGSTVFFLLTNFGAWLVNMGGLYPFTLSGLTQGFINGLPFFRNTVAGDVFYTAVLFGVAEFALAWVRRRQATQRT